MKKVVIKHDVSASGRDEGHSITLYKRDESHGWSTGELSREDLAQIREAIDFFLANGASHSPGARTEVIGDGEKFEDEP